MPRTCPCICGILLFNGYFRNLIPVITKLTTMALIKMFMGALLIAAPATVLQAAGTFSYGNFDDASLTCAITAYDGTDTESLTIPSIYKLDDVTYKVTRVEADVFHGLPSLTIVNIGPYLTSIGDYDKYIGSTRNFYRCPKLKIFSVNPSNKRFSAAPNGILTADEIRFVVQVPARVATKAGLLQLPESIVSISEGAFAGVSTVTELHIGKNLSVIMNNGGLSQATALKKYYTDPANTNFTVIDDILLIKDMHDYASLVSLAPCADITDLVIPPSATIAGENRDITHFALSALANCQNITSVRIDAPVSFMMKSTFSNCPYLREITFSNDLPYRLPKNFARDCPFLRRVNMPTPPAEINDAAFKNCRNLIRFPFSATTDLSGDSIFANTGFEEVIIGGTLRKGDIGAAPAQFAGCRNLKSIDMSGVRFDPEEHYYDYWAFRKGFAADTPNLKRFIAPSKCNFSEESFGSSCNLEKIVLQNFGCSGNKQPFYYTSEASPRLYAVTRNTWPDIANPIGHLFGIVPDVELTPSIYCDAWDMSVTPLYDSATGFPIGSTPNAYYIPGATYYIPALASSNYKDVPEELLHEMFSITATTVNDGKSTRLECRPLVDGLVFNAIYYHSKAYVPLGGIVELPHEPYLTFGSQVGVEYRVNDILMKTTYPSGDVFFNQASADGVPDDTRITVDIDGRRAVFSAAVEYTVTDIRGIVLARGAGQDADMSALPSGIYIINARNTGASITCKIIL